MTADKKRKTPTHGGKPMSKKSLIPCWSWRIEPGPCFLGRYTGTIRMIRAIFTGFLASLLLITWADDICLGNQTPDDPSDDCCSFDNDNFLPCEVRQNSLIRIATDLSVFQGTFDSNEARVPFALGQSSLTPVKPRLSLSLFYIFMSLLR